MTDEQKIERLATEYQATGLGEAEARARAAEMAPLARVVPTVGSDVVTLYVPGITGHRTVMTHHVLDQRASSVEPPKPPPTAEKKTAEYMAQRDAAKQGTTATLTEDPSGGKAPSQMSTHEYMAWRHWKRSLPKGQRD